MLHIQYTFFIEPTNNDVVTEDDADNTASVFVQLPWVDTRNFMFGDSFFKKVEKKTNINKETILSLADKLQKSDMKDENTLREVIKDISVMTGKEVSKGV